MVLLFQHLSMHIVLHIYIIRCHNHSRGQTVHDNSRVVYFLFNGKKLEKWRHISFNQSALSIK